MNFIKHSEKIILLSICLILLLIPLLFWGNLYIVGGDDTRLYYLFPEEFLFNFSFSIISDNALGILGGYGPVSFFAPITAFIAALKILKFLNTQLLMYGLNFSFGFLFFYLFLGKLVSSDIKINNIWRIVGGIFYVLSIYLVYTIYKHQLITIYLISVVPATLYFFFKAVTDNKTYNTLISVMIFSVLSVTPLSLPWTFGLFLTIIPLLFIIFLQDKKAFIRHSLLFIAVFMLLNLHWIIHYLVAYLYPASPIDPVTYYNSNSFKESNAEVIKAVANVVNPRDTLLYTYRKFDIYQLINVIPILTIIIAGIKISIHKMNLSLRRIYWVALVSLMLSFIFISPNFGDWNLHLFLFLHEKIPFFSILRNMFDKFAFALAFNYGLCLAISLLIIHTSTKKHLNRYILYFAITGISIISSFNMLFPNYNDKVFSTRISGLNSDFHDLAQYMHNNKDTSNYVWLPLNAASYLAIADEKVKNHYYLGSSPIGFLTNKTDITGILSFGSASDPELSNKVHTLLKDKNYAEVGEIFKKLNINYVIVNNNQAPSSTVKFLYANDDSLINTGSKEFKDIILGRKIEDFGSRYSLYLINDQFRNSEAYLVKNPRRLDEVDRIKINKLSSTQYKINTINMNEKHNSWIVVRELFNKNWNLVIENGEYKRTLQPEFVDPFQLSWRLTDFDKKLLSNEKTSSTIYFKNQYIADFANLVSFLTLIISSGIVLVYLIHNRIKLFCRRILHFFF